MNLQDEIKALKQRIAELEQLTKQEKEFPKVGDEFWYVYSTGKVFISEWDGFASEEGMLEIGNIFRTKEQAEFALERLKVEAELQKFSRLFKENENNYYIELRLFDKTLLISVGENFQKQGVIYFESEEKAQQAIDTVGEERIKKYLFGGED